jgi:hypothetical protein
VYRVSTKKLRNESHGLNATGYLLDYPVVGRVMVLFREAEGRMVTTMIQRVLGGSKCIYVETENSLYRVTIHEKVKFEQPVSRSVTREKAVW